jgi:[ribosomal protein S5]-alanine N-acetyltransferase
MEIVTERLVLRPTRHDDIAAVYAYMSDPEVMRFDPAMPFSEEVTTIIVTTKAENAENAMANNVPIRGFVITLKETQENGESGQLIGDCGLRHSEKDQSAEMVYHLNRNYWNRGYATEVARALVTYGFETLGLTKIIAECEDGNFFQGEFRDTTVLRYGISHA